MLVLCCFAVRRGWCGGLVQALTSKAASASAADAGAVLLLQVWVVPELREDGRIYWTADSDSQLTKVRGGNAPRMTVMCMFERVVSHDL